ncbi:MAG: nitroreductase family protein [Nitrosomonadales bacterium]
MSDKKHRVTEYNINDIFINRWSRRAYTGEAIDDQTLFSLFEAARWAPSANNSQPWRFIYVKNGSEYWDPLLKAANERNQRWAAKAGVLIVLISKKTQIRPHHFRNEPGAWRPSYPRRIGEHQRQTV